MHKNASISYQQNESNNLIRTILSVSMSPVVSNKPIKGDGAHSSKKKKLRKERITAEKYESSTRDANHNFTSRNVGLTSMTSEDGQISDKDTSMD